MYLGSVQRLVMCIVVNGIGWRREFVAMSRLLRTSGTALSLPIASHRLFVCWRTCLLLYRYVYVFVIITISCNAPRPCLRSVDNLSAGNNCVSCSVTRMYRFSCSPPTFIAHVEYSTAGCRRLR